MEVKNYKNFFGEFIEFTEGGEISPDASINNSIKKQIKKELIYFKLNTILLMTLIHIVTGAFTIAICPQFHIHLIKNFMGLLTLFMKFGPNVCSFLCGFLFLSLSLMVASVVLGTSSKLYLYRIRYYKIFSLILASLFVFKLLGNIHINLSLFIWISGACVGSYLSFLRFKGRKKDGVTF